jgi:hypothetical protein
VTDRPRFPFWRILGATFSGNVVTLSIGTRFENSISVERLGDLLYYDETFVLLIVSSFLVSVFVEWAIYIIFLKGSLRISRLLIISLVVNISTYAFLIPLTAPGRPRRGEASSNLAAIRTRQEKYFSRHGVYLECKPSPPDGGTDSTKDEWMDAGGFAEIGFEPDGPVRYQYTVTVSDDGKSFVATAAGDVDEDGEQAVFSIDTKAASYPKVEKSGDDF